MQQRYRLFAVGIVMLGLATPLMAQRAKERYDGALARARTLRESAAQPAAKDARLTIRALEDVARQHPTSGYSDDALWHAGLLAADLYSWHQDQVDAQTAIRLLRWLIREYPHSKHSDAATSRLSALGGSLPARGSDAAASSQVAATRGSSDTTQPLPSTPVAAAGPAARSTGRTPALSGSGSQPSAAGTTPESASTSASTPPPTGGSAPKSSASTSPASAPGSSAADVNAPMSGSVLRSVSRAITGDVERVSIELESEVAYREERLSAPARLFFDLQQTVVTRELLNRVQSFESHTVRQIRLGKHPNGVTRVVLNLDQETGYSVFALYNPYRIVVEFPLAPAASTSTSAATAKPTTIASAVGTTPAAPSNTEAGGISPSSKAGTAKPAASPTSPGTPARAAASPARSGSSAGVTGATVAPPTVASSDDSSPKAPVSPMATSSPATPLAAKALPPATSNPTTATPPGAAPPKVPVPVEPHAIQKDAVYGEPELVLPPAEPPVILGSSQSPSWSPTGAGDTGAAADTGRVPTTGPTAEGPAATAPISTATGATGTAALGPVSPGPAAAGTLPPGPVAGVPTGAPSVVELPATAAKTGAVSAAAKSGAPRELPVAIPAVPPAPAPTPPPATSASASASAAPTVPAANASGGFSLARQLGLGVSRIVLDPGHGGHDPGALGKGITEADATLDIGLRLEKLLLDQGTFDVVMTRRTDAYIALEERTAIANRASADLFLSIHLNSSRNKAARGFETYYLNFASDPAAEAVAARENSASTQPMNKLPGIVQAIALNNKLDESKDLASLVQQALSKRLRAQSKNARDLGVKRAPFVVLIGASMPSVLAEVSFISHAQEMQQLKTEAYRQRIAQALFDAILQYRRTLKSTTTIAQHP